MQAWKPKCEPVPSVSQVSPQNWSHAQTLLHVRERGSGVLSDFSCHMGQGSSPILALESDPR